MFYTVQSSNKYRQNYYRSIIALTCINNILITCLIKIELRLINVVLIDCKKF